MPKFTFYNDPAHGWLEVTFHEMRRSGLEPRDFSTCSYRQRNTFYLEEDCDAPKFIAAWQEKTGEHADYIDTHEDGRSFIRDLPTIR